MKQVNRESEAGARVSAALASAATLALVSGVLCLGACAATLTPAVHVKGFGPVDSARDVRASRQASDSAGWNSPTNEVQVYAGRLPKGLILDVDGALLMAPEARARYELLGEVSADYSNSGAVGERNYFWTGQYRGRGRTLLCALQAPLKALTLGMWNVMPTAWPCFAEVPIDRDRRRADLIEGIKRGTRSMGGDLAVLVVDRPRKVKAYAIRRSRQGARERRDAQKEGRGPSARDRRRTDGT